MKSYKIFLTAFIFFSVSIGVHSQDSNKKTKVHLKDGSILIGEIIEDTDRYVKIVTATLDTIEIGYKQILSVGDVPKPQKKYKEKPTFIPKVSGFFANASFGSTDQDKGENGDFRATVILGKRINERFNLGFEFGIQEQVFSSVIAYAKSRFLILGVNGKHFFSEQQHRWFADGSLGYGIALERQHLFEQIHIYKGGINSQLSFGRQWSVSNTIGLFFKAGVGYQHATGDIFQIWDINPVEITYRKEYLYPLILIGLEF